MVRCGKALTGPPNEPLKQLLPIRLQTAISIHSTLDFVKQVNASEKIGYGGEYTTTETQWIGTVPIGYGDGLHQYFKATGVLVEGKRLPIIGRIAMDQLMIALDRKYPIGTRVTFIGQQDNQTILADEVAREANIPRSESDIKSALAKYERTVYTNSYKRSDTKSALAKHEMKFKHKINYNDWSILYKDSSAQRLKFKESLAITALKPDLNATTRSIPLFIFPDDLKNKKKVKFKLKQNG
ncbi:unnamed protein product [Rotaria sordida]|uniref:Alanine racemase C-terminal domain-containing protein n=1 Tax=Rotaria sordida TaxID=392033 RepID=A0A815S8G9_9BILA|nr:unnamed protein product [Rotaria sordida]